MSATSTKRGGKRKGAGRKRKADEVAMIERMDASLAPQAVWESLAKKVKQGNIQAIRAWIEYRYGKPSQQIDLTTISEVNEENTIDLSVYTDEELRTIVELQRKGKNRAQ